MYRPERSENDSDVGEAWSSDEEEEGYAFSPESWAPPSAPGQLASSLELGTQPWVRNEWRVVEEEGETEEAQGDGVGEPLLPADTELPGKRRVPPPGVTRLPLGEEGPAVSVRSPPKVTSPRFVMVGVKKSFDELWLDPSKAPKREKDTFRSQFTKLLGRWASLTNAPRELWIIYGLKFLSSYAYFSLMLILTTFLTDEYKFSDTAAGWTYGMYGLMSTLYGLLCGWFIDYMGVRRSLIVGAFFGAIARAILAFTPSSTTAVLALYTVLPFSECLGIPIMSIGIKRYTNSHNRTYAFSLFYSMMNLAALCSGPAIDSARVFLRDGIGLDLGILGFARPYQLSSLRVVILSGSISTALMFIIVYKFVREIDVDAHGNVQDFTPIAQSPFEQTKAVLRNPVFWRLTLFTFLLIGVRLVFRHLDATFPKFVVREFGRDAPYGMFYSINPLLIIFLVPVVGLVTRHVPSFTMIKYGTIVAAASPFVMCIGASYFTVILFMIVLSIGEAVYSPRVYEYTMEVSGHGAEGLYSSLAAAPLFSVQLIVGGMSGWLLTNYVPAHGPRNARALWAIIGATAMTSPIFIWILRDYIHPTKDGDMTLPSKESDGVWKGYGSFRKSRSFPGRKYGQGAKSTLRKSHSSTTRSTSQAKENGRPPKYPKPAETASSNSKTSDTFVP